MRLVTAAVLAAMAVPAMAQGVGGTSEHSTTTTQTTTSKTQSGDTTTTTTTTSSETSSSGSGWRLFGTGGGAFSHRDDSYESLGGKWLVGETAGGKTCEMTLDKTKFISNYGAHTGIGCPEGLFGVSSWLLTGDEIRLMSPAGSLLAKLHPAGNGRWNGKTTAGLDIFMTRN